MSDAVHRRTAAHSRLTVVASTLFFMITAGVTPTVVMAQDSGIGIGIAAGANVPTADYDDAAKEGLVVSGFVALRTTSALGVRGSLFWSRSDLDNPLITDNGGITLPSNPDFNVTGTVDLVGASLDLTLGPPTGTFRPYLVGGVGAFQRRVSQDVEGAVDEFRDLSRNDTDVGFNGGVGLNFSLGNVGMFVEARYYSVATKPSSTNFVPVVVGLTF